MDSSGSGWDPAQWQSLVNIIMAEVPKLLLLAPPQDFALIYAPPPRWEKHVEYYIWNINNLILL
jgi:hypothetical protein